jgi:KaiC/GvpD/RAD55 family RecA-like ATPase
MNIEVRMDKPITVQADLENLPAVFWPYQDLKIWTTWNWVLVKGRWTKPPFQTNGSHARSQGPETWCTYADALDAVKAGKADGIGIMLHGMKQAEIIFDIDHCRDVATGEIMPWAREIIDEANSYTEVTPSGTGVRILGHGDIGRVHKRFNKVDGKDGGLEVYTAGEARYITVTGMQVPGCWPVVGDISAVATRLVENKGRLEPEQSDLAAVPAPQAPAPSERLRQSMSPLSLHEQPIDRLADLVRNGAPEGQRSEQFHHAVGLARRLDWTPERLEEVMRRHPNGIASKYLVPHDRLAAEIVRCWGKVDAPEGPSAAEWAAEKPAFKAALENTTALDQAPTVPISSPWDMDVALIPAREWIIRGLMIRNHISILVAPGGSGKSLLSAQWAIALAMGLPWGGWTPIKAEKVLLINAEDDGDEMMRRIYAACKIMDVNPRHLIGRLFLADDPRSIVVAKTTREKVVIATPLADAIKQTVEANGIGVVIVDPFAETFEGDENSNSEVKWAAAIWRAVARDCRCSVMLVHHTPKYAKGMAGDADAARGAGALVNSARIVSTLFTMTDEEGALFGIKPDQSHKYVRFDDAKANLTLITGKARWFEKISHDLPNGDSVGVLKPWKPPGVFDGVSVETITDILRTLDAGRDGGKYLFNVNAANNVTPAWAGAVIMDATGCDRDRAAKMMREWLQSGLLVRADYTSENRHAKVGVRVDFSKRPGVE